MTPLKLLVTGYRGRMGRAVLESAANEPQVTVVGQVEVNDDLPSALASADCVIDFTFHAWSEELVRACVETNKNLVMGTTGHGEDELKMIGEAATQIPLVHAPNFSVGVNTLFWLGEQAARVLGPDFDMEVVEMHHRMKKDAPSGTARRLAEVIAEARRLDYLKHAKHGRHGLEGERPDDEIGIHALRGGSVVGDHTAVFAGAGERIELTHKAESRETFASGAVRAALWLRDKKPGLYDMMDVLGLRDASG